MRINCVTIYLPVTLTLQISLMLIVFYMPMIWSDDWSQSCASNCTCKWTNGKKSAICSSLQLTTIPTTLSTELQVLVLNDNHIPYLNREEFINLGLMNLQRIYLKKSEVHYLHKEAFKDLKILVEIDLSDNRIEMLDKGTFTGNDRLRILYLNGNPLKRLVAYQFPILPHLRTLDLHDCLISYIDPMALANLNLLEFLYLKNNLLESLSEYVFHHMINLKTLVLDENPWQCNCKLRKFRTWYVESNLNSVTLMCKGPPSYKNKPWDQLEGKLFGCAPRVEIFNNEDIQNIEIGSNITFSCLVYGDPMPTVSWELNGKILDNDNVIFETEHITSDKLWSNLTIFNMTSFDAGTYVCTAINIVGVGAQNISIYLTEIVQHVLIKTPETFWYFGLIMGTFGTVFLLILLSFVVCLCKRTSSQRRHPRKPGVKPSVSFNDQEKKLLDLSITTTTNDRGDSCVIDSNHSTTTMSKAESVLGSFEPIEIHSVENHRNSMHGHHGLLMAGGHHHHHHHHHQLTHQQHQQNQHMTTTNNALNNRQQQKQHQQKQQQQQQQQLMAIADGSCSIVGIPPTSMSNNVSSCLGSSVGGGIGGVGCSGSGSVAGGVHSNPIPEEYPLNMGVFPPPPEFCSNLITNPGYGNIFISVSVTQDMLDSADVSMYPDLLNIAKRGTETTMAGQLKKSASKTVETALQLASRIGGGCDGSENVTSMDGVGKVNVTSFATLPRNNQRRGILKKDTSLQSNQLQASTLNQTNLYPHEEIVSYHNLDATTYNLAYQEQQRQQKDAVTTGTFQGLPPMPPPPPPPPSSSSPLTSTSSCHHHNYQVIPTTSASSIKCPACLTHTNMDNDDDDNNGSLNLNHCSTPPLDLNALRSIGKNTTNQSATAFLKYDNMGRRITASGNSVLSLPDEERLENEILFNEGHSINITKSKAKTKTKIKTIGTASTISTTATITVTTTTTTTITTTPACKLNNNNNSSNYNNYNNSNSNRNSNSNNRHTIPTATTIPHTINCGKLPQDCQMITTQTLCNNLSTHKNHTNVNSNNTATTSAITTTTTTITTAATTTITMSNHHNKKIVNTNNEFVSL